MKITEAIRQRYSVRTYTGKPLDAATIGKIKEYIAGLEAPFGVRCRIDMLHANTGAEPVKIGSYGSVKGAADFITLAIEEGPLAEEGAAYIFEQAVLYCTSLGLGTCWLGGLSNKGYIGRLLNLNPGEKLRIVSPVGYASDKHHLSLLTIFGKPKPKPRKPFTANFFHSQFGTPLTEAQAGLFAEPLEMVRLAPSANNKQSWRVVMDERALHFYRTPSMGFDSLDLGIALCHFEQTCRELNIPGHYEILDSAPAGAKAAYVISWMI